MLNLVVIAQIHARANQRGGNVLADLLLVDKPDGALLAHQQVAHHHRRAVHIRAADVERPRDIVKHVGHMHACAGLLHDLARSGKLLLHAHAGILLAEQIHLLLRHSGAILPDFLKPVARVAQRDFAAGKQIAQVGGKMRADHGEIHAAALARMAQLHHILLNRRHAGNAHAHQRHAGAFKLLFRLNEVAAIGKQRRLLLADNQRTGRAGEAAQPLAGFKMLRQILGGMGIGRGHNHSRHIFFCHARTERADSIDNVHIKNLLCVAEKPYSLL